MKDHVSDVKHDRNRKVTSCRLQASGHCVVTSYKCPFVGIEESCPILLKICRVEQKTNEGPAKRR